MMEESTKEEEKRKKKRRSRTTRLFFVNTLLLFLVLSFLLLYSSGAKSLLTQETKPETEVGSQTEENREEYSHKEDLIKEQPLAAKEKWSIDTGAESATVLLYLMGSDLESQGGCASRDIGEILRADLGDKVNVVIQTGGAAYWHDARILADSVQRFQVQEGELILKEDMGLISMVEKDTLTDFIRWGVENYPADRTILILWNHGGGTLAGYGYDEYFEGTLLFGDLAEALQEAGVYFDFIGFDACLMATIENAYALSPYADYLIASEEMEPGSGWYYTGWLNLLGENPGINMEALGEKIVRDYLKGPQSLFWNSATLTVLDLEKIPEVYEALCQFMAQSREELSDYGYYTLSLARSKAKSYGEGEYDQIDIVDYIERTGQEGGRQVADALEEAIVCHDSTISNTNGLAMYFPYDYLEYYGQISAEMDSIGMGNDDYREFFDAFVNLLVYGQEDEKWQDYPVLNPMDGGRLYLTEKEDGFVLQLTEEEWSTITYIELQVFIDDGEGYLDLGADNVYSFDEDGDLAVDFDYTWVALNGQIVPFYAVEEGERWDGSWYSYGVVPAELTRAGDGSSEDVELLVYWDEEHEGGYVTGYRPASNEGIGVAERNLRQLERGDRLDFFCEYYNYQEEYEGSYYFGNPLIVQGELEVTYEKLEEYPTDICYYLQDIYRNEYWTEKITIFFE